MCGTTGRRRVRRFPYRLAIAATLTASLVHAGSAVANEGEAAEGKTDHMGDEQHTMPAGETEASPHMEGTAEMTQLAEQGRQTLMQCQAVSARCALQTADAPAVLVFPEVTEASLIVGGQGARGVLMSEGQVKGYYTLGAASIGAQAGVQEISQVYVFTNQEALSSLVDADTWRVGVDAEITVIDAGASAEAVGGKGDVTVYVFDQEGLAAGVSIKGLNISRMDDGDLEGI